MESSDDDEIFLTQNQFSSQNDMNDSMGSDVLPGIRECVGHGDQSNTLSDEELSQHVGDIEATLKRKAPTNDLRDSEVISIRHDIPTAKNPRFKRAKTDEEMGSYTRRSLAKSTESKCRWAAELFRSWQVERNRIAQMDSTISAIKPDITEMTKDEICYSVSRFVCEVIKNNGEEYPGATLYEMVISLQLYLETNGHTYKLMQDHAFLQLQHTLDHVMKERAEQGIVRVNRKAEIITLDDEDLLWKTVLGSSTPRQLIDTMLYLLGLNFALRAGGAHRQLRWKNSQLSMLKDSRGVRCICYREDVSKSNQGGLKHRKVNRKVVYAYENSSNPERCIVELFQLYDRHCPPERPAFYLRPLNKVKGDVWFSEQPIGVNQLTGTVARLCEKAGVRGFRTNHSLRATAATRVYQQDVDEQIISEITGHRSSAVRHYKRTSDDQRNVCNDIVCGRRSQHQPDQTSTTETSRLVPNITVNVHISRE